MNESERFERVCSIFEEVRELAGQDQRAKLSELCDGDEALRDEVESMLGVHRAESPLDQPSDRLMIDRLVDAATVERKPVIDRYEIGERLGAGGMGVVYSARMRSPERAVAIKVIRLGMGSEGVIARFDLERRALAWMEHPNIASVLDAGVTSDGRPYFAMELVRGESIVNYCDAHALGTGARLRLFIQVCNAIQHAHQKGIIHRDIKPSNVIVAEHDGVEVPKVIDFGIAKATQGDMMPEVTMTMQAQALGTPVYMSPEQADQSIGDMDTRTDVYSLGVLLYEILTGTTPLIKSEFTRKSYAEMLECIRDQDPPRPSARLATTLLDQDQQVAVLPEQLKGDLDWIVMKCLEKDPNRRYGTVSSLAEDLTRYLNDEPVLARPASRSYITRKFIRRHRGSVIASGVVLGVLLLGITGTSFGLAWAINEQENAKRSEQVAQNEARVTEETVEFLLTDLLGAADPARMEDRDLTVRQAVTIASESVEGKFADKPLLEARIRTTIARTLDQLGSFRDAEPHHRRILEIYRSIQGDDGTDTLNTIHSLASNLIYQSRYDEAIGLTLEELDILRSQSDPDTERLTNALSTLGEVYLQTGQYDKATPILEEALQANRDLLGDLDPKTLASMHNLAGLYGSIGNKERALQLAKQAYEGRLQVLGPGDPKTFGSLNVVTWVLNILERNEESIAILQDAIAQANERLGETHLQTIALTRSLANLYYNLGEYKLAEQTLEPMVEILRSAHGDENLNTFTSIRTLGVYTALQDREEDALPLFAQALELARGKYPPDSFDLTVFMDSYGASLARSGRFAQAELVFLEAMEILKDAGPAGNKFTQNITESMISMYTDWHAQEPDAAREAKLEALMD